MTDAVAVHTVEKSSSGAGRAPLAELVGAGISVPLVQGGRAPYANLDYAASAPCLQQVADRVAEVLPWYSSVHRGTGYLSQVSTSLFEAARVAVCDFLGACPDDVALFTRNTTDALNLLARSVPEPDRVLFLDVEHHANLLPWQRRHYRALPAAPTLEETLVRLETGLDALDGVRRLRIWSDSSEPVGITSFTIAGHDTALVATFLSCEHGIGVREGRFCAHPLFQKLNQGKGAIRASYGLGTTIGEIDRLVEALESYLRRGAAWRYASADGTWSPLDDRRPGPFPDVASL